MKKIAGAAVTTLLIATMLTGSVGIAPGAATMQPSAPQAETTEVQTALPAAQPAAEAVQPAAQPAANEYAAYLFVHFIDTEETSDKEQIYYSVSTNGTDWTTLNENKPVLRSTVGEKGVRDPHIIRTPDNKFRIVATDLSIANRGGNWGAAQTGGSRNIIVWKGDKLTEMGEGSAVAVGTEDALDVWAPESIWDVDKEQYMVTWASIVGDRETQTCYDWKYRIYRSYTTDFETFTDPEVYMEREDKIIDTTFYYNEANKMYYRFTKDEDDNKKWVFMEQGEHLDGEFEMVSTYSLNGEHYSKTTGVEGPTVYKLNGEDKWCLLLDNWTYKPYETDDITKGVFTTAGEFQFNGPRFRHGSVIPITQAEYDELLEAYPVSKPEEPDPETGKLIYQLDFEGDLEPVIGTGAAVMHGTTTFIDRARGNKKAVQFNKDTQGYLSIPGSIFANLDCFTVSFMAKIPDKNTGNDNDKNVDWLFLVQKDDNGCVWQNEKYLSVLWEKGGNNIVAQRYNNTNSGRPEVPSDTTHGTAFDKWVMITVIYGKSSTKLYINAELKSTVRSDVNIRELLGENPVAYLGFATWGSGEYSYAAIDTFRVYDGAISQSTMQSALANESLIGM